MTDRNAAFDAERAGQMQRIEDQRASTEQRRADMDARVAAGEMESLGGGRYRSLQGWDQGEVWNVDSRGIAVPQHNLDMSTGEAALYSRYPEWHKLGTIVPAGLSDMDAVLRAGKIDFTVSSVPVEFSVGDGRMRTMPDQFVNFREDTFAPLGVVGSRYTIIQNSEAYKFLEELLGNGSMIAESAGATYGGAHVFVSTKLPEDIVIDQQGVADVIRPYVVTLNTHDGSGMFKAMVTPWRPRCGNTERFMVRDAAATWGVRHTRNATDRVAEAQRHLANSVKYFERFAIEENTLARTDMAIDEFRAVMAELWPEKDEKSKNERGSKRAATMRANRESALMELYAENVANLGQTAYAGERAVTDYLDHHANKRVGSRQVNMSAARATSILEGTEDKRKNHAHKLLLQLAA